MSSRDKNINFTTDRIISIAVLLIYAFLIVFGLVSLSQPDWLLAVSEVNRKQEVGILINKGILLSGKKQETEAIKLYDKALKIIPGYSPAIVNKAISFKRQKKYHEAISLLNEALNYKDVDSSNVYSNLKDIYFVLGDSLKANKYFDLSLHSTHNELDRLMRIGNYFLTKNMLDSAYKAYHSALQKRFEPKTYFIYVLDNKINKYNISSDVFNFDINVYDIRCYNLNLEMDKGLAENYNKLGFIHALKAEYDTSLAFFYKAVNIWTDYYDANQNIRYVQEKMRKMNSK